MLHIQFKRNITAFALSRLQHWLERACAMRKKTVNPILAYLLLIAEVECEQKSKGNPLSTFYHPTLIYFQPFVLRHRTPVTTGGIVVIKIMIHKSITRGLKLTELMMLTLLSSMETFHWQKFWIKTVSKYGFISFIPQCCLLGKP